MGERGNKRNEIRIIYDFAPIPCFTLDANGVILQLNLAGAILLGVKRSEQGRYRFADSVSPEFLNQFKQFHADVLHTRVKKACAIELMATSQQSDS